MQNNTYEEETFNVTNTSIARTTRLHKLTLALHGGPEIRTLQDGKESDDNCFAGNEGDESDTNTSGNDSDSGDSDNEVYS